MRYSPFEDPQPFFAGDIKLPSRFDLSDILLDAA
jgi:hypothetical protein